MEQADKHYQAKQRVTLVGAGVNVLLALFKIVVGWIGQSQALIADGLHSLSDLISDGMVLVAAKYGSRRADADHPYGHARFETLAAVGLGILLMLVGLGVMYDAGRRLLDFDKLWQPSVWALVVTVFSILAKEGLYHYTMHVARAVRSQLLKANAWHHRTDSISSFIVLIGVGGVMLGVSWLDAVAAMGVALMIIHVGWSISWQGVNELVDKGLGEDKIREVREIILSVFGVRALHMLRTRRMGEDALVDVHILVNPTLSVSEGHQISETVRQRLMREMDEVNDVTVHIDPEDDEKVSPNAKLPLRDEVVEKLRQHWSELDASRQVEDIVLHYLGGRVAVDVYLPLEVTEGREQARRLAEEFANLARRAPYISRVRVYYH